MTAPFYIHNTDDEVFCHLITERPEFVYVMGSLWPGHDWHQVLNDGYSMTNDYDRFAAMVIRSAWVVSPLLRSLIYETDQDISAAKAGELVGEYGE